MVEEVEVLIRMMVYGMVMVVMEVTQLEVKDMVEVLTVMVLVNLVELLEVVEVVVTELIIHRMLEVVEVALYKYNILGDQEVQMVTIGAV